jgi:2-keto-4-pentenoate hydratase/2-oxohepta-3-ene-1,7-dioic acid hydratase in catechol pathway
MKLATFTYQQNTSVGKLLGNQLLNLTDALPQLPRTLRGILEAGEPAMEAVRQANNTAGYLIPLATVKLEAPIQDPPKILAIGMNYQSHLEEAERLGIKAPTQQLWFNKQVSCVTGPYDPVYLPRVSSQLDYEAELGVVIGKRCKHVKPEVARSVIAGYLCVNDFSLRDWQGHSPTFTMGKSFDTTGPMGPFLVTDDEIPDPQNLAIRCLVNGEVRQDSVTRLMIHNIWQQIAYLSTAFTLQPGDVIVTGTPEGVGVAMEPPRFLKVGDVTRVEIEGLGYLENRVIAEPA